MSDLLDPYFCVSNEERDYQKKNTQRNVYHRNFNDESKHDLYDFLKQCNILSYLSNDLNADPNVNYNILEEPITRNLNNHKNKKSEWITVGLIRLIKYRDTVYKRMKQLTPNTVPFLNI